MPSGKALRNSFANRFVNYPAKTETNKKNFMILFVKISREHLFPPRQEAEDKSQQHKKKRERRAQINMLRE
jgi:hypothetical protein